MKKKVVLKWTYGRRNMWRYCQGMHHVEEFFYNKCCKSQHQITLGPVIYSQQIIWKKYLFGGLNISVKIFSVMAAKQTGEILCSEKHYFSEMKMSCDCPWQLVKVSIYYSTKKGAEMIITHL